MNKDFRFVILGAGNIAGKFADAVGRTEGCRVSAAASKTAGKAEAFALAHAIPGYYGDYERLLEKEKPDCAYIATTGDSHSALSRLCLKHGVPVLCEKAMFSEAEDAGSFFQEAERRGVFSMEALWSRFLPAVRRAKEWLESGRIGEMVYADFDLGFIAPRDGGNRYFNPGLGGGAANDLTVYGLHLLPYVTGRKIESAYAEVVPAFSGVDETELVLLGMAGGLKASLKTTFAAAAEERMVVYGTHGKIVVPKPHMAASAVLYDANGKELERFADTQTRNGFVYEIREAVRCVRAGLPESPVVPHSATMSASAVIGQIHSRLNGRR